MKSKIYLAKHYGPLICTQLQVGYLECSLLYKEYILQGGDFKTLAKYCPIDPTVLELIMQLATGKLLPIAASLPVRVRKALVKYSLQEQEEILDDGIEVRFADGSIGILDLLSKDCDWKLINQVFGRERIRTISEQDVWIATHVGKPYGNVEVDSPAWTVCFDPIGITNGRYTLTLHFIMRLLGDLISTTHRA